MSKPRFSPQRAAILKQITLEGGHLTAEEIHKRVKGEMPKISLATVYRNLKQLEKLKEVSQVQGVDQMAFYERFSQPHHHFICRNCGDIINLASPTPVTCMGCIAGQSKHKIEQVVTTLIGVCEHCLTG